MILQRRALSGGAGWGLCSDKEIAQSYTGARRHLSLVTRFGVRFNICKQGSAGQSSSRRQPLGRAGLPMVQRVKDQFDAAGDPKFFEDAEEIFLYGVLAKVKFHGDLSIAESFSHQRDDLLLAWREKRTTRGIKHAQRRRFGDQFHQPVQLLGVKPDLPGRHPENAFPEHAKIAVRDGHNPSCPRAEPLDYQIAAAGIGQYDFCDPRMAKMKTPQRANLVGKIGGSAERQ